jgi:hypothetical protein
MYISVGTVLAVLLCIWVGYVLIPELDRVAKEREWSRPEREAAKRRKKEKKLGVSPEIEELRRAESERLHKELMSETMGELYENWQKLERFK